MTNTTQPWTCYLNLAFVMDDPNANWGLNNPWRGSYISLEKDPHLMVVSELRPLFLAGLENFDSPSSTSTTYVIQLIECGIAT